MAECYKFIKPTDNTNVQRMPVNVQAKILLSKLFKSDSLEFEADEKVNREKLVLSSSLANTITKVTRIMQEKGEKSVAIKIPSIYIPYLDEVIDKSNGKGRYYDFKFIDNTKAIKSMDYFAILEIRRK